MRPASNTNQREAAYGAWVEPPARRASTPPPASHEQAHTPSAQPPRTSSVGAPPQARTSSAQPPRTRSVGGPSQAGGAGGGAWGSSTTAYWLENPESASSVMMGGLGVLPGQPVPSAGREGNSYSNGTPTRSSHLASQPPPPLQHHEHHHHQQQQQRGSQVATSAASLGRASSDAGPVRRDSSAQPAASPARASALKSRNQADGFGKVYKGTLMDGTYIAVKQLDPTSLQGDREFYSEVAHLMRLRHQNLVSMMGMVLITPDANFDISYGIRF
eukprot:gene9659-8482_t